MSIANKKDLFWMLIIFSAALAAMSSKSFAESVITLSGKEMTAVLSDTTGQVASISDAAGARVLAGSEDRYDLDGKTSTESEDTVVSRKIEKNRVSFECLNKILGIKISKQYRLAGNVLEKETKYLGENKDKLLFKLSSQSTLDPDLYKDGYYYTATEDGWKVFGVPFIAGTNIKEPTPWTVSTGSFVYYFPKSDRVFTHYRYKVDGKYFYSEVESSVESKLIPGGAVTSIGLGFISDQTGLNLESRYALIPGDPSDYHRYLLNQPPYTEYKGRSVPDWFKKGRLFLSNVGALGLDSVNNREAVGRDVGNYLKLLDDDEYLMVFFMYWSATGDYPYQGSVRMYDYGKSVYADPMPVEKLKENIKWLKAISPRVKVGGYVMFMPTKGTPPYDNHPDWLVYNSKGDVSPYGDGTGIQGVPDFSSGYREYLLDQMKHFTPDLGFDWIHMDCGPLEAVNYKTKNVVQSYEHAKFYDELRKIFEANNAAVVQNVAYTAALWSDLGEMECQQPDRWEKKDWRVLAVMGSLADMYRNNKPGAAVQLVYGTQGIYGIRNAQSGMRGWIRGGLTWWRDTPHSLAYEKVADELLETRHSSAVVHPSWWKLETDRLEAEALEKSGSLVIPVLLHGDKSSREEISIKTSQLPFRPEDVLFSFDLRLFPSTPLDVFQPVPWRQDYLELLGFQAGPLPGTDNYTHRMDLEPLRNYYHLLTQVPGWVYTYNDRRCSFPLSENQGVKITGRLPQKAVSYKLQVENKNKTAQIMAFVPEKWVSADIRLNGKECQASPINVLDQRCLLINVPSGKSDILVSENKNKSGITPSLYANPSEESWREAAERLIYYNLEHRAYQEDGKSCLALKTTAGAPGGSMDFHIFGRENAGGFNINVKGEKSGGKIKLILYAGDPWTYEITDDFIGWKEFNVYKEQMTSSNTVKKWDPVTLVSLQAYPVFGKEINIADIYLLPARPGDIVKAEEIKRKLTIYRTKTPPVIDGYGNDACWKNAEAATDFFKYPTTKPADSKSIVKVCYDNDNLYVIFDNLEPIIKLPEIKSLTEYQVFTTDHCHFFIDPYRDGVDYYEIGIDGAGTIADIKNSKIGWDIKWNGEYELKIGINYNVSWTAEIRIPFKTLGKTPKGGEVWGITFARVDNTKEFSVWTNGAWNDPADFGDLVFGGEAK